MHHNILPLISQYIFSLLVFAATNKNQFQMNSEIRNINTKNNSDSHELFLHLTSYQKSPSYMSFKVYNSLPPEIKDVL